MCFTVHEKHRKVKIAKQGITCWKVFTDRWQKNIVPYDQGFKSEYLDFKYNFYKLYTGKLDLPDGREINEGFHSYSTIDKALSVKSRNQSYVECFIPIGAKYYYNPRTREYVSDSIYIMDSTYVDKKYGISLKRIFNQVAYFFNQF